MSMTNTNNTAAIPNGSTALCYYDPIDGTYTTSQRNPVTGGTRVVDLEDEHGCMPEFEIDDEWPESVKSYRDSKAGAR